MNLNSINPLKLPRRWSALLGLCNLLLTLNYSVHTAEAAAPTLTGMFPSGAQRGTTMSVKVTPAWGQTPVQIWCSDNRLQWTLPDNSTEQLQVMVPPDVAPGVCWVRLFNAEGASQLRPFIIGTIPDILEAEPNDQWKSLTPMESLPRTVHGVLSQRSDVDTVAVSLKAGETLVASVVANTLLGSPMDAVLQVLNPAGFVLDQNHDDQGLDPRIVFTAPTEGVYYLRVFAFPSEPNSSIRLANGDDYHYQMTLTTGPFIDHVEPLAVTPGQENRFRVFGWNLSPEQQEISLPVEVSLAEFTLDQPNWANSFMLPASAVQPRTLQELRQSSEPYPVPLHVTAQAVEQKPESYRIQGTKGQKVRIRVEARAIGSLMDPSLRILDSEGKELKQVDDTTREQADIQLDFAFPADDTYEVQVKDLHLLGGMRYFYRLSILNESPAFTPGIEKDRHTLKAGEELQLKIQVNRDNHAENIEFQLLDPPQGISAQTVVSEPKGGTEKEVTLVIKAELGTSYQGPIRIIGKSPAANDPVNVTAPIDGLKDRSAAIWLTVTN